jgi:hypothetical protein
LLVNSKSARLLIAAPLKNAPEQRKRPVAARLKRVVLPKPRRRLPPRLRRLSL